MSSLGYIEEGMRFARYRAAVLASDAANASSSGFTARDVTPVIQPTEGGLRFAAAIHDVGTSGDAGTLEYAMGGIAKNSVWYRALAQQAHSVLREFRTVAEESRR